MNRCPLADLRDVGRSFRAQPGPSAQAFSTRHDYIRYLIERGHIKGEHELSEHPQFVMAIQNHWHGLGQTGCKFAQMLSRTTWGEGWSVKVISEVAEDQIPVHAMAEIEKAVVLGVGDPQAEMISLIFPWITSTSSLVSLIKSLSSLPGWHVDVDKVVEIAARPPLANIAIRVTLNEAGVLSWVLGLGPFEFMPATRRSPFTELAIRTKPVKPSQPFSELNIDPMAAHLADIPARIASEVYARMWAASKDAKMAVLGVSNDPTAKARVTFAIPAASW